MKEKIKKEAWWFVVPGLVNSVSSDTVNILD